MEKEQFDPKDDKYKKVADLPREYSNGFVDVSEEKGGGFIKEEANSANFHHESIAQAWNYRRNILGKLFKKEFTDIDVAHEEAKQIGIVKEAIESGSGVEAMDNLFMESKYFDRAYSQTFTTHNFIAFNAFEALIDEYPELAMQLVTNYLEKGKDGYYKAYRVLERLINFNKGSYEFFEESVNRLIEARYFDDDNLRHLGYILIESYPKISQTVLEVFLLLRYYSSDEIAYYAAHLISKHPELEDAVLSQLRESKYLILAGGIKEYYERK